MDLKLGPKLDPSDLIQRSWGLRLLPAIGEPVFPLFLAPKEEPPANPTVKPSLGQLTVTDATPDSLRLSWTVPEGQFDHFLVQYKNGDGQPKAVRVPGHEDGVTISGLEPDHKYKMNLYGVHDGQRQGPVSAIGVTGECRGPRAGACRRTPVWDG